MGTMVAVLGCVHADADLPRAHAGRQRRPRVRVPGRRHAGAGVQRHIDMPSTPPLPGALRARVPRDALHGSHQRLRGVHAPPGGPNFPSQTLSLPLPPAKDIDGSWLGETVSADTLEALQQRAPPPFYTQDMNNELASNDSVQYLNNIELAKAYILATNKISKKLSDGTVIHGGYSTCSRAIAAATAEGGGGVPAVRNKGNPPWNAHDASFYGQDGRNCNAISGGCWQVSSPNTRFGKCGQGNDAAEETALLTNPFCGALLAFTHRGAAESYPAGANTSESGEITDGPGYCKRWQYRNKGEDANCYVGPILYSISEWNSPPQGATFRTCSRGTGNKTTNVTTGWNASCPEDKAQYSCTRATCACEIAKDELVAHYGDGVIDTTIYDQDALDEFVCACNQGPNVEDEPDVMPTRQPQEYFTVDNIGTQETDMANIKTVGQNNGADPSCGTADAYTWQQCGLLDPNNSKYAYTEAYRTLQAKFSNAKPPPTPSTKAPAGSLCNTCGSDKQQSCQGIIMLVNPTPTPAHHQGRVACLLHGTYSGWEKQQCSTGHYYDSDTGQYVNPPGGTAAPAPTSYTKRVNNIISIMENCGKDGGTYTQKWPPSAARSDKDNWSCLVKEKAFQDAGVPHLFPEGSSHGAVAVSKGHGFLAGACGSTTFVRQGQNGPNANNTLLNVQIGTRAWSGEVTDSSGGSQQYINDGYLNKATGDNAAYCIQPKIMKADEKQVDTVLEHVRACQEAAGRGPACAPAADSDSTSADHAATQPPWESCYFLSSGMAGGAQCSTFKTETECQSPCQWGSYTKESPCACYDKRNYACSTGSTAANTKCVLREEWASPKPGAAARRKAFCAPQTTEADCTSAKNAPYCEWKG